MGVRGVLPLTSISYTSEKVTKRAGIARSATLSRGVWHARPRRRFSILSGVAGINLRKTIRYAGKNYDPLHPRAAEPGSTQRDQYCCDVLWVEFKTANRKAGKHQLAWHAVERARGFTVWVANETFPATVDGFREYYAKSGLMRRPKWW